MSMAGSLSDSSSVAHVLVAGDVHPPEAGEPGQLSRAQTSWKGFVPSQAHIQYMYSCNATATRRENSVVKWQLQNRNEIRIPVKRPCCTAPIWQLHVNSMHGTMR